MNHLAKHVPAVFAFATLAALQCSAPPRAWAQDWPTRPLTMVVPFAPGGPIDVVARIQGQRMGELLGQTIIIENVGGAGGGTGSARVANAAPDGYQLLLGNIGTHAFNQTLYKKPPYNAATDFAPVGLTTEAARVLVVRKDLPVGTLPEFIAYAKANQAKMQFGSAGAGSATHIPCVLLNMKIGAPDITHVPYRGAGPAMQDLIAGRVDFMCDAISTSLSQIQEKNVKPIALLSLQRAPVLPDLKTAHEQGLADFGVDAWNGFFLPKGTPDAIVRRLNKAVNDTLETPYVRERLDALGLSIVAPERRSPDYLASFVRSEIEKWADPIKASGVSAD
jgi:tripartite-type tricarboxylate transporter receptor subunit TctC